MEYNFKLADVFPEEVSLLSNQLIPLNCPQLKNLGKSLVKERVRQIVDDLGKASAHAQELESVVTSAEKLENGHDKLYVFCDLKDNRVVGFLKIGTKKLFLFDEAGVQHELKAPCILDFFIHETRQRKGAGKYLMDHVLRKEKTHITHFAVDYPTDKMIYFLRKNYNMTHVLPQINNFVLFDGFFEKRPDYLGGKVARWTGVKDLTDAPLDEIFHCHHDKSRLQDSAQYILEHPHQKGDRDDHKAHLSQRRHESQMHDHGHPHCDAADLQSNGNGMGENGMHWSEKSHDKMESRKTQCHHDIKNEIHN